MSGTSPKINFAAIDFPSDQLTLKQLRVLIPDLEDRVEDLDLMHMREQEFAILGFARELGDEKSAIASIVDWSDVDGVCDESREMRHAREHLAGYYVEFGLAPGLESALELIRKLEGQGSVLARKKMGSSLS